MDLCFFLSVVTPASAPSVLRQLHTSILHSNDIIFNNVLVFNEYTSISSVSANWVGLTVSPPLVAVSLHSVIIL